MPKENSLTVAGCFSKSIKLFVSGAGQHRYQVFTSDHAAKKGGGDMLEAWLVLMVTSFPGSLLAGTKRTTALRPCTFFWSPAWEEHLDGFLASPWCGQ